MMELKQLSRKKNKKPNHYSSLVPMKTEAWGTPSAQPPKAGVLCSRKSQEIAVGLGTSFGQIICLLKNSVTQKS